MIIKLKVKYKYLENPIEENSDLFEFIYKNNLYEINERMVNKIVFIKGEPRKTSEKKLEVSHYTTVKESEAEDLKQYIEQNINEYIGNVFLQIETNTQEDEKYIVDLLNNEDLEIENKQSIIEKEEAKISDISEVKDKELWEFIFEKNKITASWKNILNYYQYKEQNLDEIIIDFISIEENYKQLSNDMIYNQKEFDEDIRKALSLNLIKFNKLNDKCYSYIINSLYSYSSFSTKLDIQKIDILLKNKKLTLTQENINYLKEYNTNKQIILIENFKEEFLEKHKEFILDENDYIGIFKSTKFSIDEKMTIINELDLNILDNEEILKLVTNICLKSNIEISNNIFYKIFNNINSYDDSLKLLIKQIPTLEEEQIQGLLGQCGEPYDKLSKQSEELLKFDKKEINKDLLVTLKEKDFIKDVKFNKKEILVYKK